MFEEIFLSLSRNTHLQAKLKHGEVQPQRKLFFSQCHKGCVMKVVLCLGCGRCYKAKDFRFIGKRLLVQEAFADFSAS